MTSVLIVVLNWNGIDDTEKCLPSLLKQTYKNFDILVIDNGSTNDSLKRLRIIEKSQDKITVIANQENLGFAGGVNTGIRYAIEKKYDAVALFNNDATADPTWLSGLVKALGKKDVSIATGLLLHANRKTIDSTGDYYSIWGIPSPRERDSPVTSVPKSGYVFGASGGASLYRTALFKEIGLFDRTFFLYYEDVDISFRAQLSGHKVYFTNEAVAYHKQGASSSRVHGLAIYHTFKNLPSLYVKNVPTGLLLPIGLRFLLLYVLILGNAIKNGAGSFALKGWLASIGYFWIHSLWYRFAIQAKRKVTTSYINSILLHDIPAQQTGMRKFRRFFTGKP